MLDFRQVAVELIEKCHNDDNDDNDDNDGIKTAAALIKNERSFVLFWVEGDGNDAFYAKLALDDSFVTYRRLFQNAAFDHVRAGYGEVNLEEIARWDFDVSEHNDLIDWLTEKIKFHFNLTVLDAGEEPRPDEMAEEFMAGYLHGQSGRAVYVDVPRGCKLN